MPTISVLDSAGAAQLLQTPNGNGQALMAASRPVVLASDQSTVPVALQAGAALVGKVGIDQTTPGTTNGVSATGNVANATADAGNGVKGAGVYSTSSGLASLTAGNRADLQSDIKGNLRIIVTGVPTAPGSTGTQYALTMSNASGAATAPTITPLAVGLYCWSGTNTFPVPGDAGGVVTQPFALASARWNYAAPTTGIVNSAVAVTIAAAAGAGVRNYLDSIQIDNDTLGAATEFAIRDGAAGTVLWRGKLGTAAQYGRSHTFADPLKGTANTLMEIVTLTASVTGGVFFNGQGHTAP